MSPSLLSSIGPMLAAPWQQRRNNGSLWGLWFVAFMVFVGPGALFCWALSLRLGMSDGLHWQAVDRQVAIEQMMSSAVSAGAWAVAALVLAGWAVVVSNLLDQNRPVLARLVPRHPARLRVALVVAWAACVGIVTLVIGSRFGVPLVCVAAAGPVLAVLALSVRWPMMWMLGIVAPIVMKPLLDAPWLPALLDAVHAHWVAQSLSITLTLAAASVVALVGVIQSGSRHHVAADEARRNRVRRFQMRAAGAQPMSGGKRGAVDAWLARPYYAAWKHVVARRDGSSFGRLMLGLGPGVHWTMGLSVLGSAAVGIAAVFGLVELVGLVYAPAADFGPDALASLSAGLVIGLLAPSLQVQARLHQTRREQSLLVLLPGVPHGPALSRRLAWQFTGQFLVLLAGALLLMLGCEAMAHAARAESLRPVMLRLSQWIAAGALPLAVFQWRPWARVGAATPLAALQPMLLLSIVISVIAFGHYTGAWSVAPAALGALAAAVAWCAWRWRRMGVEPASLPMGRLA